jgi:hypothetical protein
MPLNVTQMRLPDFGPEAKEKNFYFSKTLLGLEDPRSFLWQGRVHLMGTVSLGNWWGRSKKNINLVGLAQLGRGLGGMEDGAVLNCPGLEGQQKNYMPLVVGGALYVVIQAHPLVVGRVDPDSLECAVVHKELAPPFSLQAVRLPIDTLCRASAVGLKLHDPSGWERSGGNQPRESMRGLLFGAYACPSFCSLLQPLTAAAGNECRRNARW